MDDIIQVTYSDEMQQSYLDYSVSVLTDRALPDIRDGLKPVQRKIIYDMSKLGITSDKPYRKSARIVGDTMGRFHPHGDSSIYESMVHLEREWLYAYPLIDGHGNFGSIEGDGPAAMRYTEARLAKIVSDLYIKDLDKGTVPFKDNYENTEKEPETLPVAVPGLLLTGSEGIAVGMACKIPTHNMGEVIDGLMAYMDKPDITTAELMQYIKGPDFATGGEIANMDELVAAYEEGKGRIRVRGTMHEEDGGYGKTNLVVTEIPPTMVGSIDKFMGKIADMVRDKTAQDITDIKNLSGKDGIRIVIELKKGANIERIKSLIFKQAKLEDTYGLNMVAIVNGAPRQCPLLLVISEFSKYQMELYTNKYNHLLEKEREKEEIQSGLIEAVDVIDLIIEILRGSKKRSDAKECLMYGKTDNIKFKFKGSEMDAKELHFTEKQTDAILDMRLSRLIGLELDALKKELDTSRKNIEKYTGLLGDEKKMKSQIKKDLVAIKEEYSSPRMTRLANLEEVVVAKEEVKEQLYYALIDRFHYIKLIDEATYQRNMASIFNDFRACIPIMNTDKLYVFTSSGKRGLVRADKLPATKYKEKGVPLDTVCGIDNNDELLYVVPELNIASKTLFFASDNAMVKRVEGTEFISPKRIIDAYKKDGVLVGVADADKSDVILESENGLVLRFSIDEVPVQKKTAAGVRGMKLPEGDKLRHAYVVNPDEEFTMMDKQVTAERFKLSKRDNKPVKVRL